MSNILSLLIERIEYDQYERLIEEGKDPSELLHYKFQYIPSEVIDKVISIDPTKKKSYSQWLLSKWKEERPIILNGLQDGDIEKLFQHYKNHNDLQIKDCPSVEVGLRKFVPKEDSVLTKSSKPMTYVENLGREVDSSLANDFDIVYNDGEWVIAVPNTYEAECKLGENMRWCTANCYGNGEGYYDNYLSKGGKYYVNFDMTRPEQAKGKDYPFTRYQFHFESNQFMDKDDDPVELDEIGMPEGAKEYYAEEGYDTDQFENLEARIERYDNQRWGCRYQINDDLYLCIAYDDDYEFTEPDAETDFYVFGNDDDRDPISWDEVPNPHLNEGVVLHKEDNFIILKKKYGEENSVVCLYNFQEDSRIGYRNWHAKSFNQYIMLPNNMGIFGVDTDEQFAVLSPDIEESCDRMKVKSCEKMFVNEQCTKAYSAENEECIFVETVSDGHHSLFNISISPTMGDDLICVVYKDTPINGEYFTINEQGLVEGEFRSYRVYDESEYEEGGEVMNYDLEAKLPTNDYLISMTFDSDKTRKYNILKKGSNQPLINFWFNEYVGYANNLYGIKMFDKITRTAKVGFFAMLNGEQVGRWYDGYQGLDKENGIIYGQIGNARFGSKEEVDIINGEQCRVMASFTDVVSRKAVNNKVVILDKDGVTTRVYDYIENKFYFPELGGFLRIDQYEHPYLFACNINGTEERVLFDLSSQKLLVRNIKKFVKFSRYNTNYMKLVKMNGKCNVFDINKQVEMLPNDVDEITGMNQYTNILIYAINGKYYPLNYKSGNIVINPNGIGVPTYVNDSEKIYCSSENYDIWFILDNGLDKYKFWKWQNRNQYNDYGTNFDPQTTPQEVLNMYNLIFNQQESIKNNFKAFMKRIDEVSKLRINDIID